MDEKAAKYDQFRDLIISDPDAVLEDREIMRALVAANGEVLGENVVDLRGIALNRLETRLARLEDTHRSVIAAAYENLAGTNQIHRAILRLMEETEFPAFLSALPEDVAQILNVDAMRLVLESLQADAGVSVSERFDAVLTFQPRGFVSDYAGAPNDRPVLLRQTQPEDDSLYGEKSGWIRSEACIRLHFGEGKLPGMLLLGSEDPHRFKPTQGTDLLTFFGGVFERALRRWLA